MNLQKELAAHLGQRAASKTELHITTYNKHAPLASLKNKLLIEISGLVRLLCNPFLSRVEKEACQILFFSTIRKLIVLQNGYCVGCGCAGSTNSERPE